MHLCTRLRTRATIKPLRTFVSKFAGQYVTFAPTGHWRAVIGGWLAKRVAAAVKLVSPVTQLT